MARRLIMFGSGSIGCGLIDAGSIDVRSWQHP
jgi:hypothetical protein